MTQIWGAQLETPYKEADFQNVSAQQFLKNQDLLIKGLELRDQKH